MQIAVGGCLAQKDRATITEKAPWVDVVFGTHNIGSLPALLERARANDEAQVEILESLEVFPSTLPDQARVGVRRLGVGQRRLQQHLHVLHRPGLRGKEKDRRPGEILSEVEALVAEGVSEITLLGQNVNAYGVEFGDRQAFCKLLRACGDIEGLERVRFTSPHPAEFTDDVIEAMAETPNVMPSLHMPLQSGSDRVLKAMRRSYRQEKYLGIIDRVRAAIPDAAITTDIIVGFPGETEEDFQADPGRRRAGAVQRRLHLPVLQAPRHPRRHAARPDRPGGREGPLPAARRGGRRGRLGRRTSAQVGRRLDVMVAEGEGRKDAATHRLSGRAPDNRLVHFQAPDGRGPPRRRRHRRGHLRRPAPPRRRRPGPPYAAPAPATPGRPAPRSRRRRASGSACRPSACPRRCLRRAPHCG